MRTRNIGIELDQSTDFSLVIGIFGESGPIDITGYQFKGEMRSTTDSNSPVVAEFNFAIQNQVTNKGEVVMSLSATQTDEAEIPTSVATALTQLRQTTPFVFDVKMLDTSNKTTRILQGIVYVSPEATQESA